MKRYPSFTCDWSFKVLLSIYTPRWEWQHIPNINPTWFDARAIFMMLQQIFILGPRVMIWTIGVSSWEMTVWQRCDLERDDAVEEERQMRISSLLCVSVTASDQRPRRRETSARRELRVCCASVCVYWDGVWLRRSRCCCCENHFSAALVRFSYICALVRIRRPGRFASHAASKF